MKMASAMRKTFLYFFIFNIYCCFAFLEQGVFEIEMTEKQNLESISKSMYNRTKIALHVDCSSEKSVTLRFIWYLWYSKCANEYQIIGNVINQTIPQNGGEMPDLQPINLSLQQRSTIVEAECGLGTFVNFPDESHHEPKSTEASKPGTTQSSSSSASPTKQPAVTKQRRKKREEQPPPKTVTTMRAPAGDKQHVQVVATTEQDGFHLFILQITPVKPDDKFTAIVKIDMEGPHGYLSAIEWPLLPFYGTMCLVYLLYGVVWLVLLGCNWRDLLRVQFWIGGVIFIGMLEKAVFFAEFESVNTTGKSVKGALVFAEIVSSLKRATARVLVVIVSLGFGIVKPRLGAMLHKVVGVGALYFILATVESCVRVLSENKQNKSVLISSIPLAVLDAALCWWIFTSLVQTTRTLRLRRNVVKLSLYRHFTNTLIFAVLASVAYMIWSIKQHKFASCLSDWRELWVDDAFWHILFCIILMVIMVLWRPTINNQRYAFSPLLDAAEEDDDDVDEEKPKNEALDAQKRSTKTKQVSREKVKSTDEDLKWIDENIPASVADTALPSLLDSDEEIMTTKYEMSKME